VSPSGWFEWKFFLQVSRYLLRISLDIKIIIISKYLDVKI